MKIGFFGLLTLMFIGFKISGHIDWSWWIILAPFYAPLALALPIMYFLIWVNKNKMRK